MDRGARAYRDVYAVMHEWMLGTTGTLTAESAMWSPPGECVPAGAHFAHHALAEDLFIRHLGQGEPTLAATEFAGRTGFDKEYPSEGPWNQWAREITIDLDQLNAYASAVFTSIESFLASLSDADLDKMLDLSAVNWGEKTLSYLLDEILVDGAAHTGEISAIKGMQGLQGYPF
ncbi:MAG: DinB family protein [Thermomicrobiales bacterium]